MNFYAHLVAASWQERSPAFALGAMLPDFASMAGLRLDAQSVESVAAGVLFHHDSDRVFHRLQAFRDHERWTMQHMLASGLRRGPARGIAHVGVELSLDGALVGAAETDALYLAALQCAESRLVRWERARDAERFRELMRRLRDFGVPIGYRDAGTVAERLVRIMRPRPLLRLSEAEAETLRRAISPMHERVGDDARGIMSSLRAGLSPSAVEP